MISAESSQRTRLGGETSASKIHRFRTLGKEQNIVDENWRSTDRFNHVLINKPMIRGDYIRAITVTQDQFYEIMDVKFFIPSQYSFYPITPYNIDNISKQHFNDHKPMYNIYFNKLADKGFFSHK
jgi:hypothetical protein